MQLLFKEWQEKRNAGREAQGNAEMTAASVLVKTNDKERRLENLKKAQETAKANNLKKKGSTAVTVPDAAAQAEDPAP